MLKIIGGIFRGRLLRSPKGDQTRPSSGLLRKAFFDICMPHIADCSFLDLFAGSGAMGIEAISRGARFSSFVDKSPLACRAIKQNIEQLNIEDQTEVFCLTTERALELFKRKQRQFDLIFIDPPYGKEMLPMILDRLAEWKLCHADGKIFAEEAAKSPLASSPLLELVERRQYGDSVLLEYHSIR